MESIHVRGTHTHWFWIIPFLFMILMIVCAIRMARRMDSWRYGAGRFGPGRFGCWGPGHGPTTRWWSETPLEILDRRYASGEITTDQYEQMRHDIESSTSHSESAGES